MIIKWFLISLAQTWAEGAEHAAAHDPHAIPWHNIFVQTLNFLFLFAILFFVLRKSVQKHFTERAQSFKELVAKAESAKQEAEKSRSEIQNRLRKLETSATDGLNQARAEAEELRQRLIQEAKELAQKLSTEAEKSAQVEIERAKAELRRDLLTQALETSRQSLKSKLGKAEQKQLENEFAEKIQVVRG